MSGAVTGSSAERWAMAAVTVLLFLVGVTALLVFWNTVLRPGDFASLSLPVVAFVAALASAFSPCSLPALPAFITFGAASQMPAARRAGLSFAAAMGAVTMVLLLGGVVTVAGAGTKGVVTHIERWVQLGVGILLMAIAAAQLTERAYGWPFVRRLTEAGGRIWDRAARRPSLLSGYLLGLGFVAVGLG